MRPLRGRQRGELRLHPRRDLARGERHLEVVHGAVPGAHPRRDAVGARDTGETEAAQRAVDRPDRPQRGRDPDGVHVEGEPAARVADARIAPAPRVPPAVGIPLESHEVRRDGLPRVRLGPAPNVREVLPEGRAVLREEATLALGRDRRVCQVMRRDDGELEVVVDHVVVLAHRLEVREQAGVAAPVVLGGEPIIAQYWSKSVSIGYPGYFLGKNYLGECATVALLLSLHEMLYPGFRRKK